MTETHQTIRPDDAPPLVTIEDLHTQFFLDEGTIHAVDGVDLVIPRGRTVGIVGESGCGKSVTAFSIMRLVSPPGRIVSGRITLHRDSGEVALTDLDPESRAMRQIRGREIAMIFQEPMTSLSPVHTVGSQITEAVRLHTQLTKSAARRHAVEVMDHVGIPDAGRRFKQYPHQMSGGLRQRGMIAMALSCRPALLIADEPTTALDVTIQAQILDKMRELQTELGMSILLITHDLGVVAETAQEVAVMYMGRIVERATTEAIFASPRHPYTRALLKSIPGRQMRRKTELSVIRGSVPDPFSQTVGCPFHPRCDECIRNVCDVGRPPPLRALPGGHEVACWVRHQELIPDYKLHKADPQPLLSIRNLKKHFPVLGGVLNRVVSRIRAVDDVSFDLFPGECLALVGESGSGKTTVARTVLRALAPTAGEILFHVRHDVIDLAKAHQDELKGLRRHMQMIFQDPYSSLNPRMTVQDIIAEPLLVHGMRGRSQRQQRVRQLLKQVGLKPQHMRRYPHAFSGGQRQRIGIARALALNPKLIVADEPVSALDVSVQAQVLNLLQRLQAELGLTYLFIAHDLGVVRHISDRVAVMYVGRLVELTTVDRLFETPAHPYTEALLSAVPVADPTRTSRLPLLRGEVADPGNPPAGCHFHPRCRYCIDHCRDVPPDMRELADNHLVRCHLAEKLDLKGMPQ